MWYLVALVAAFIVWRVLKTLGYIGHASEPIASAADAPIEKQEFTPHSLEKYNGLKDPHVLIAVKGRVYDVTSGKAHYGPGGPYENFAGRDASRGLAKHSFDASLLTPLSDPIDSLSDLTEEERQALNQWEEFFAAKYPFVGPFKNP